VNVVIGADTDVLLDNESAEKSFNHFVVVLHLSVWIHEGFVLNSRHSSFFPVHGTVKVFPGVKLSSSL